MGIETADTHSFRVLTVGHSDHSLHHFLELLKLHLVEVIVDTRSYPYSKFAPQYNQESLRQSLRNAGFQYVDLGRELGGRPEGDEYYDSEGHVLYGKVADSNGFKAGIARLEEGIRKYRVALMCAEENPTSCHRRLLIGRVLLRHGTIIEHIRGAGCLQSETELSQKFNASQPQMNLFKEPVSSEWKSIPSVLRRKRASSFSAS